LVESTPYLTNNIIYLSIDKRREKRKRDRKKREDALRMATFDL